MNLMVKNCCDKKTGMSGERKKKSVKLREDSNSLTLFNLSGKIINHRNVFSYVIMSVSASALVAGRQLPMKPSKVVAGHEPEKTNEFLQVLAEAINKQVRLLFLINILSISFRVKTFVLRQ